jgi:hypothetical protein
MKAINAPPAVEFQIHHVVPTLKVNAVKYAYAKKLSIPRTCCLNRRATTNKGIQATNTRGVILPENGKETVSKAPESKLSARLCCRIFSISSTK